MDLKDFSDLLMNPRGKEIAQSFMDLIRKLCRQSNIQLQITEIISNVFTERYKKATS